MEDGQDRRLRLLAPAAVALFAVLLLIVVLSSGAIVGSGPDEASSGSGDRGSERSSERKGRRGRARATYAVKAGDTLGSIARRNDTTVDRLQELNPQLDPQALTAGQRIRLRE